MIKIIEKMAVLYGKLIPRSEYPFESVDEAYSYGELANIELSNGRSLEPLIYITSEGVSVTVSGYDYTEDGSVVPDLCVINICNEAEGDCYDSDPMSYVRAIDTANKIIDKMER